MGATAISDIIITSRIRLARNIRGFDFPYKLDVAQSERLTAQIACALPTGFSFLRMSDISPLLGQSLVEMHAISPHLLKRKEIGSVFKTLDNSLSVMVNEEDHIREQCITQGLSLQDNKNILDVIDKRLIQKLLIAFDDDYGFLTHCLTNVGTGMRASVMIFLPALCLTDKMQKLVDELKQKGITMRGTYGEGTHATSYLFQVSNSYTIGITDTEIIREVTAAVHTVMDDELRARKDLESRVSVKNIITDSYDLLKSGKPLDRTEFVSNFCNVKLGIGLGYFAVCDVCAFNKLIDEMQDATLLVNNETIFDKQSADLARGKTVAKRFNELFI